MQIIESVKKLICRRLIVCCSFCPLFRCSSLQILIKYAVPLFKSLCVSLHPQFVFLSCSNSPYGSCKSAERKRSGKTSADLPPVRRVVFLGNCFSKFCYSCFAGSIPRSLCASEPDVCQHVIHEAICAVCNNAAFCLPDVFQQIDAEISDTGAQQHTCCHASGSRCHGYGSCIFRCKVIPCISSVPLPGSSADSEHSSDRPCTGCKCVSGDLCRDGNHSGAEVNCCRAELS